MWTNMKSIRALLQSLTSNNNAARRRRRRSRFAGAQRLEVRSLLAGNVAAIIRDGSLLLTGDNADNAVDVVMIDNNLVVRGRDNTTVNGSDAEFIVSASGNTITDQLFASLGSGNDDLFIEGAAIGGNVSVETHHGTDRIGLRDTTIGGSFSARTGTGDDGISLVNVTIARDFDVHTGRQSDAIELANTSVGRNTRIRTDIHDDSVVLDGSTFAGKVWINTSEGHDNIVALNSTINGRFYAAMGRHHDFVRFDTTTVSGNTVIRTHRGADNLVFDGVNQFRNLTIDTGRGGDNTQVDPATSVTGRTRIRRSESGEVTDGVIEERTNHERFGAISRTDEITNFFRSLSTVLPPLTLQVTPEGTTQSNDTLVTNESDLMLQVVTQPGATVAVDADNDGDFDDAMATADDQGNATLTVTLTNDDTNNGANTVTVQASNDVDTPLTEQIDVHYAMGTVVRFDSSLGTWDVELFDADAPNTVGAFLNDLTRYDSSIVHRNVSDFIIQGGGFDVNASGEVLNVEAFPIPPNEFNSVSPPNSNLAGTISTAQNSNINSFSGQWFFNAIDNDATSPINNLDSVPHTAFGRVIGTGMNIVNQINNTPDFDVSGLLTGSGAFALTDVPLVNYTPGEVPTDDNFIAINSITTLLSPPGTDNTFSIFENSAVDTVVGTVTPVTATGSPVIFEFNDPNLTDELRLNADDHLEGDPTAPAILIEYLSLQCPTCAAAHPQVEQLLVDNPGDVIVVRRHLPLDVDQGGPFEHSFEAALAAEAAGRQGAFDGMVDELFARQSEWTNSASSAEAQAVFDDIAENTLGLDMDTIQQRHERPGPHRSHKSRHCRCGKSGRCQHTNVLPEWKSGSGPADECRNSGGRSSRRRNILPESPNG